MKTRITLLFIVAVLCATFAFAANGSAKLDVRSEAKIGDKTLTPGDYTVTWSGTGETVDVVITTGKKVEVVKATAKLTTPKKRGGENFILKNTDGTVQQIYIARKNVTLVF